MPIGERVVSIGEGAFYNNGLTAVDLPDSLTEIGYQAFNYNNLTSVTLPDSLTAIGANAFTNNKLTAVTIPNGVTYIPIITFYGNSDLATVTLTKKLYDLISSRIGLVFGYQVTTHQTHDGTKLN